MRTDHLSGAGRLLKIIAFIDGASRKNPGPAGYGAYLTSETGEVIEVSGYLGTTTNNVAEYHALVEALQFALDEGADEIEVVSDSELLVRQMLGAYRVKHANLLPLHRKARELSRRFRRFTIRHVLRAGNKEADRLANLAVDRAEGVVVERKHAESH